MELSIIIPVYNAEGNLKKLLESLVNQYLKGIEIILIDDGSTDNSFKICKNYADKYAFIKLSQQKNEGASAARNKGLDIASGKYIAFIDSDDRITNDYLETSLKLCKINTHLIQFDWLSVDCEEKYKEYTLDEAEGIIEYKDYLNLVIMQKANAPWNKIYMRELIEKYNIRFNRNMIVGEDIYFTIKFLKHASNIYISHRKIYVYFLNKNGICGNVNPRYFYDNYRVYVDMCSIVKNNDDNGVMYNNMNLAMLRMIYRTIGFCIERNYSKQQIKDAIEKSKINVTIKKIKCNSIKDKVRLILIRLKMYYIINKTIKKR